MKNLYIVEIGLFILLMAAAGKISGQFTYISPLPGSKYHNPETTIILKTENALDKSSSGDPKLLEIIGSVSGQHSWKSILSGDKTLIIKPAEQFTWGESVTVTVNSSLQDNTERVIEGTSFSFTIRAEMTAEQKKLSRESDPDGFTEETSSSSSTREECEVDSLPPFHINVNNNASPGQVFYNNQAEDQKDTNSFPVILENDGTVVWTCDLGPNGHDFKINNNGYITYFSYMANGWMVVDSNMEIIDTIKCGNGYQSETNGHDMLIFPDGHAFVIAYNVQIIDMSQVVEGGKPNAQVKGLIVQELDADEEVIFEWRSWDHFQITDANATTPLTGFIVDYVHGNAVEEDVDGNIMISCRNMSEITKINLGTGEIIWRMGGKNNQFQFVNDNIPEHFAFQHDIRRINNDHVTLFNNGVDLPVQKSSAKEYALDEVNKVATLVWYYEHPKIDGYEVFGSGSGSVQRLSDGGTFISWGKTPNFYADIPNYTEIDSNENITWEFVFDSTFQRGYRAHKYIWRPCQVPAADQLQEGNITSNSAIINWNGVNNGIAYDVQYRRIGQLNWKTKTTLKTNLKLKNLAPEKTYEYQVRSHCENGYTSDWTPLKSFQTSPLKSAMAKDSFAFNMFPNPASGIITFEWSAEEGQPIAVSVFDVTGKEVITFHSKTLQGETVIAIDISGLSNGFYFAEVKYNAEKITRKFIKQ